MTDKSSMERIHVKKYEVDKFKNRAHSTYQIQLLYKITLET